MVEPLRHRQTKGAATDMFYLMPPRHISTLRKAAARDWHLRIDLFVWNPCVTQCVRKERKDLWHNPDRDGPAAYCEGGIEFPHTLCFCDRFGSTTESHQCSGVQYAGNAEGRICFDGPLCCFPRFFIIFDVEVCHRQCQIGIRGVERT